MASREGEGSEAGCYSPYLDQGFLNNIHIKILLQKKSSPNHAAT